MSHPGKSAEAIHLACASDENYVPYCATMLRSALIQCRPQPVEVHFLHPAAFATPALAQLQELVESLGGRFDAIVVGAELASDLRGTEHFPRIIWYRALLPQLRPALKKVLYLDCDTLVLDSLLPLWSTPLADHYAAAVQNLIEPALATRHHALGIPPEQTYFNSGVLLLNLALMRREGALDRLFQHARQYGPRSIWPDQDSLNYALGPKTLFLHPRWNCQNSFFFWPQAKAVFGAALAEAVSAPAILHFEGPDDNKPWHYLNRHPYRARYWEYLRATGFPVPRPAGRTQPNVMLRYAPAGVYAALQRTVRRLRRFARQLR